MRSPGPAGWLAGLVVVGVFVVAAYGQQADAARFSVSISGRDTLVWSVGDAQSCGRRGSGRQTVEFASAHAVTLQIGRESVRGHPMLIVRYGRASGGIAVHATVTREDTSIGEFTYREHCETLPAKDCGTQPLTYFAPTLSGDQHGGFALHGPYYPTGNPPFHNCLALVTPVNLVGNEHFYRGWDFGEELLSREGATMATAPVSPQALRVGRTYHFTAHRIVQLSDSDLPGFVISDDGGSGSSDVEIGQPETPTTDDTLGGDRSITDNASWAIALKRLS